MHVQWQPVGGATGYTVSYQPVRAPEATKPKEVRDVCFLITRLFSNFIGRQSYYTASIYESIYNLRPQTKIEMRFVTCNPFF